MNALFAHIAALHFLRPWWLLGLLAVPALAWWWRAHARRQSAWQGAVDAHLLPHLLDEAQAASPARARRWTGLLALALALIAMAGPSLRKDEQPLWQVKAPLVVALDLSNSALANDLPPTRLAQARGKLAALLRDRAGGQVALVAFADDAYTVAPLTDDAANVALFLDALAPDVMPVDGHRVDRAIAWSQRLLRNAGFAHGDILVLTDRAEPSAMAEAVKARAAGYRVSVLGLGTAQGGVVQTSRGVRDARLDAGSLRTLAASGGGGYQALVAGDGDLRALGVLDPQAEGGAASRGEKSASWRDDGYWLLPLVILLVLPLFRRGGAATLAVLLALWLPIQPAQAQAQGTPWRRPDQQAHARMQEGVADYRKRDYDDAIAKFTGIDSADGQYNLGNALAQAGRLDEAIAAYDRALKLRPGMPDAMKNRATVDAARKRKPPPGGNRQQPQSGRGSPKDSPGQQGQQGQQQDGRPGQGPSPAPAPPPPKSTTAPPSQSQSQAQSPQDAQRQQQADAAQRQRMQEALRKQQLGQQPLEGPPQEAPRETAEQRERRLANQAQLQRVPDDPGALLRAKFRLEYERRRGVTP